MPRGAVSVYDQMEFSDADFRIVDNGDQSKKLSFQVSGIAAGTTRIWMVPDSDVTVSAFGATIIDDADAAAARTTLGLGTAAVKNTGTSGDAVPLLNTTVTWSTGSMGLENASTGGTLILSRPATGDSNAIGGLLYRGLDDASNSTTYIYVVGYQTQDANGAEQGTLYVQTTNAGASQNSVTVGPGVVVGAPTGGNKGYGTLNATAVYDDNTLLTCYPFDAYLDGKISDEKWDALTPDWIVPAVFETVEVDKGEKDEKGNPVLSIETVEVTPETTVPRTHDDMRKFKARLGSEYDPLNIDKYAAHWKEKRHLTSMPNEATFDPVQGLPTGSWIQRLIETVEIQAIHIEQLNQRLKALKAKLVAKGLIEADAAPNGGRLK